MANSQLKNTPPTWLGLSYGTLFIPYKYHTKSKDFTAGTTVGGYIGYRAYGSVLGLEIQPIAFLGASPIPVDTLDENGQSSSENHFGVSYGFGFLGSIKNNFNMGMVVGFDRINKSVGYENNGKLWIAVQLGYVFSN